MQIIQADLSHLELLAPLFDGYRVFYEQPSDLLGASAFLTERLEKKESIIFFVLDTDQGIGFTQLYPTFSSVSMEPFYILNDLYVVPEFRGQGVGKMLLQHAQQFIQKKQLKGLALETAIDNPAQKLYEALGWEKSDGFYHYFWKRENE